MHLLGTLEDEEDAHIKQRMKEENEAEEKDVAMLKNYVGGGVENRESETVFRNSAESPSLVGTEAEDDVVAEGTRAPAVELPGGDGKNTETADQSLGAGILDASGVAVVNEGVDKLKGSPIRAELVAQLNKNKITPAVTPTKALAVEVNLDDDAPVGLIGLSSSFPSTTLNSDAASKDAKSPAVDEINAGDHGLPVESAGVESTEGNQAGRNKSGERVFLQSRQTNVQNGRRESGKCNSSIEANSDDGETTDEGDHDNESKFRKTDALTATPPPPPPPPASLSTPGSPANITAVEESVEEVKGESLDPLAVVPVVPTAPRLAAVTEVFSGLMCSVVTCGSCNARSFSTEPTICLSLEIPFKLSKTAQAYVDSRKEAQEAAAAMAAATCAARQQHLPGSDRIKEGVSRSGCGTAAGEGASKKAPESLLPGFQLSAKEKRKVCG